MRNPHGREREMLIDEMLREMEIRGEVLEDSPRADETVQSKD